MESKKVEPTFVGENDDLVFIVPKFQLYLLEPQSVLKLIIENNKKKGVKKL